MHPERGDRKHFASGIIHTPILRVPNAPLARQLSSGGLPPIRDSAKDSNGIRGRAMRHLSRACMLSIALSAASTVEAADLAPRPVPPAVAYNWSGFYVGGTVGWGWGNFNPHSSTVVDGYISSHTDVAAINATGSQNLTSNGLIGGIGAGFNWQAGNFVFGIEADAQAFRLAGTVINGGTFPTAPADTYVSPPASTAIGCSLFARASGGQWTIGWCTPPAVWR